MTTPHRPELEATDESLNGELALLARFLGDRPGTAPIVLRRLGELGDDARFDLARLRADRAVKLKRLPPKPRRQQAAARVAAVMAFVVTGPSILAAPAAAQELAAAGPAAVVREAAQGVVLRVVDTGTGKPLAGVRVKTVAEEVVAITDGGGKATVPAPYAKETVLSLEHDGYPIVLVEGEKLAARSLVSMRKFADNTSVAKGPKSPPRAVASRPAAGASDPAERLMAIALEHSRSKPIAEPPLLAAAPDPAPAIAEAAPAAPKAEPAVTKPEPVVAKAEPAATKPEPVVAKAEPVVAKAEPVAPEPLPVVAKAEPAAATPSPMERAARAPKRVVKVARADAKASRSVAVAWSPPRDRAEKNVDKVAFADAKAPRAIRVVMRAAAPGAAAEPASPLGITAEQLGWIPPVPTEQVAGPIVPVAEAPAAHAEPFAAGSHGEPIAHVAEALHPATDHAAAPIVGPSVPAEAAAHIAEAIAPAEALPFLIGRSAAEPPIAEPTFVPNPEAPHHHAPAAPAAPTVHAATPAHSEGPTHVALAPLHLPVAPLPVTLPKAPTPHAAPAHHAAPTHHAAPIKAPAPARRAMPTTTADLLGAAPFKHAAPPKAPAFDLASLPAAPKPPAHLASLVSAASEAPSLLSPEEGVKRFATINLPVRPRFAKQAPAAQLAQAAAHAAEGPMARVREHLTASRAHLRYQVKAGDMLSSIAQRELGSAALWPVLYQANRDLLTNPRWLQVGANLKIPRTSTGLAAAGAKTYVVQQGDCLSTIAREHLGDMRKWPQVFAANRHLIKNPWLIFPGQRLVLPVYVASGVSESWAELAATEAPPAGGGSPHALAD